jgi:hypothetical protein
VNLDVIVDATISRSRSDVAAYVFDHRNDPVWIGGITESELQGEPPMDVGSRVRRVASFLGKRIEYVNEVVGLEPDTRLVMRSVKSPFPMVVTYSLADAADRRTFVTIRVQGDPSALYRIGGPLMRGQVRRSVTRDLARLRAILES